MNEHKHNPCSGYPPVRRFFEFVFQPLKYIDMKSKTGRCDKCGKAIVPPNIGLYLMWVPVIHIVLMMILLKPLSKLPLSLAPLVLPIILCAIAWLVPAAMLAFSKWKDEKPSGMTDEEFVAQRVRERYRRREEFRSRWELRVSMILYWVLLLIMLIITHKGSRY